MFRVNAENQYALERAVERAAELHERQASRSSSFYNRFFHLEVFDRSYPHLSVKYNDYSEIKCENSMLEHLYTLACQDGDSSPHVPRPVHFFYNGGMWGYIVMGRIYQCNVSGRELEIKTAEAVRWLHSKHPPLGTTFGTIGRSYPCHTVFKQSEAPRRYNTVFAAQKYLNMAIAAASRVWRLPLTPLSLENDEVVLSQSDMDPSNFGVAPDGRSIIFDTATIQAMPLTLAEFTLLSATPFSNAVSEYVFGPSKKDALSESPTTESLRRARRLLRSCAHETFGLDDDGNVTNGVQSR